jgi:hypothetical protein
MLLLLGILMQQLLQQSGSVGDGGVYHGRAGKVEVTIPRVDEAVVIDGFIDEPVWQDATILTGFSQYMPVDGRPAADSTDVLVWYSSSAIHFGIRAHSPPATVRATLADRDRIHGDDQIQILLDTYNDRRRAMVFGVNPLGVQLDGMRSEGVQTARRLGETADRSGLDLNPDFAFESKGRLTDYGYEVEIRIPFRSIRYQSGAEQTWGFNIVRIVQYSGHEQTWAPVQQGATSFLAQGGSFRDLTGLSRNLVLDLTPVTTARITGASSPTGWQYESERPEVGANVRWGMTANLTLNATVNPDFSHVEADVQQVSYDPRSAVFFPEKRPFFLEGSEQFDTPNRLVYTRRVVSPLGAAKATGKVGKTDIGVLFAVDDPVTSASAVHPVINILRVRQDIGDQSTLGLVYTDRVDRADFNRLLGVDTRLVFGGVYTLSVQGAASLTSSSEQTTLAPLFDFNLERSGRSFGFSAGFRGLHPEFTAAAGFLSRVGITRLTARPQYTVFGESGAAIESYVASVLLDGTWDYSQFFEGRGLQDVKVHLNNNFTLRGGWRLGGSLVVESFGYPAELYENYWIERRFADGMDTVPFIGGERIPNFDIVFNLATPRLPEFSGSLSLILGRDENFYEWAPAYIAFTTAEIAWRPTDRLRINGQLTRRQYFRESDHSTVAARTIPWLRGEYQLSRGVLIRLVGQYDARYQDSLRDESRSHYPILIRDPVTGTLTRAAAQSDNDFRIDALFAYQPSPGTVFFAGYGSSLREPDAFLMRDIHRVSDGFFLKASYTFRVGSLP